VTGEAVSFDDRRSGRGDWTCVGCGLALERSLESSQLLEAVLQPADSAADGAAVEASAPSSSR
jgi:hypothetical protein